jgi:DNA transformation protein
MEGIRGITSRAMFGGWAVYRNGAIFAIIFDGEVYFKIGDRNRQEFEGIKSHPFVYAKDKGTPIVTAYWLVPEEVLEDRERLCALVDNSVVEHMPRR